MRRSAAPSLRVDMKRARFLPEIMKTNPLIDKENASQFLTETSNVPNVSYSRANLAQFGKLAMKPWQTTSHENYLNSFSWF